MSTENICVLGKFDEGVGFAKPSNYDTYTNKSHKAYLIVEGALESTFYRLSFEGTTAVEKVEMSNEKKEIYDLQGRKVENTTNGIYIVKGKKTLIK